jgi:hypothetical protein
MFQYLAAGVLAIGVLSVGVQLSSQALFTDTESVGSNSFATGTLDISAASASAVFNVGDMGPGDSAVDDILLINGGSATR